MATIHAWSTKWLVNFNPKKTETMTITRKINKLFHPPLIMNNTIINQVTEHKHLGLEISNDGSWQKNIDLITKKAFTRDRPFNLKREGGVMVFCFVQNFFFGQHKS